MAELSRAEVAVIIGAVDFDREALVGLMKSDCNVDLPPDLQGEELVDFVFNTWQNQAAAISTESRTKTRKKKTPKDKEPTFDVEGNIIEIPEANRTDYIKGMISNAGNVGVSQADIITKISDVYGYTRRNKNCRTRVTKVLRALIEKGEIAKKETGELVMVVQ